jgi:hypothetical protein
LRELLSGTWKPSAAEGRPGDRACSPDPVRGRRPQDRLRNGQADEQYAPAPDGWLPTSANGAPAARTQAAAATNGSLFIVWGGQGGGADLNTGGRYDPLTDTWTTMTTTGAPIGRSHATSVWTVSEVIFWGGRGDVRNQHRWQVQPCQRFVASDGAGGVAAGPPIPHGGVDRHPHDHLGRLQRKRIVVGRNLQPLHQHLGRLDGNCPTGSRDAEINASALACP